MLNGFVDDLRSIAAGRAKDERSSGSRADRDREIGAQTLSGQRPPRVLEDAGGRRYTVEWNVTTADAEERSLSYGGDPTASDDQHWYESPVQAHLLSVFPEDVRDRILADLNGELEDHVPVRVDAQLDPFSRKRTSS